MPYKDIEDRRKVNREYASRRYRENPEAVKAAARRYQAAQLAEVSAAKIARGCAKCGYRENAYALEFDHIIPRRLTGEKPFRFVNARQELARALANPNIQVLCANCHAIKSVGERQLRLERDLAPEPS